MTKRISDLSPVGINDLTSLEAAVVGIDNANETPTTSRKLSVRQIHGTTFDFWPTGNAQDDTVAFETLVKRMPLTGATLRIMDNANSLVLDPAYSVAANTNGVVIYSQQLGQLLINKPLFLCGESPECRIQLNNKYLINWGLANNIYSDIAADANLKVSINAMAAGSSVISGFGAGVLKRGDWVLLTSSDTISTSKVSPHYSENSGLQKPGEVHRVAYTYSDSGVNYAVIDGAVVDALTASPAFVKLTMLRNCGIADLTIGSQRSLSLDPASIEAQFESGTNITLCLDVNRTVGFRLENVTVDDTAAGALKIDYSANAVIEGFNGYGVPDNGIDYGVIVGTCNGVTFRDSVWHNSRHVFTTGGDNIGYDRYGTPLNVFVHNVTQYQAGSINGDILTGFDTHAEGFGVVFDSCRVFAGGRHACYGFGGRARKSVYRNCSFYGARPGVTISGTQTTLPSNHQAFVIAGSDALIDGGYVYGAAIGVRLRTYNTGYYQHDCRVSNVTFDEVFGSVLYSEDPIDNCQLDNCAAKNCSTHYYTSPDYPAFYRSLVQLYLGSGLKIRGCFFDRQSNDYLLHPYTQASSNFEIVGNHLRGYTQRFSSGTSKLGIRGDSGDPNGVTAQANSQAIQAAWSAVNYTS